MLDRRQAPLHSGDFFFSAFFFPPTNWFYLSIYFFILFTSKDYEHLLKKKSRKQKKGRENRATICMYVRLQRATVIRAVVIAVFKKEKKKTGRQLGI